MKWAGIILCILGIVCAVGIYLSGRLMVEKETAAARARVGEEQRRLDETVASAETSLKSLAEKLRTEEAKTRELEGKWDEAKAKKTGMEQRLEQLGVHLEGLEKSKDTARDDRRANMAEISTAQKKIARTEKAIEMLKQGIESVSEKVGM
ncbi:MAG: hypothetical protein A3K19_27920 [Lentisphaerae bacterium RIFOXYB12_FULL_65_16]|nr:MAG: hypothetical protein A3K18_12055 [Lentisphaerae bacterium RIFOXYA12_64_32]OGV88166.1 MAG: hypothetical protein A3K19_27920 [Lentisphaerae bacterium RIFOXYB12_FULL_65_16]